MQVKVPSANDRIVSTGLKPKAVAMQMIVRAPRTLCEAFAAGWQWAGLVLLAGFLIGQTMPAAAAELGVMDRGFIDHVRQTNPALAEQIEQHFKDLDDRDFIDPDHELIAKAAYLDTVAQELGTMEKATAQYGTGLQEIALRDLRRDVLEYRQHYQGMVRDSSAYATYPDHLPPKRAREPVPAPRIEELRTAALAAVDDMREAINKCDQSAYGQAKAKAEGFRSSLVDLFGAYSQQASAVLTDPQRLAASIQARVSQRAAERALEEIHGKLAAVPAFDPNCRPEPAQPSRTAEAPPAAKPTPEKQPTNREKMRESFRASQPSVDIGNEYLTDRDSRLPRPLIGQGIIEGYDTGPIELHGGMLEFHGQIEEPTAGTAPGNMEWGIEGDAVAERDALGFRAVDKQTGATWYWSAPSAYLGDQSRFFGGRLVYSLRVTKIDEWFKDRDIIIESPDLTIYLYVKSPPGTQLAQYSQTLDASAGWRVDGEDRPATNAEIRKVLSHVSKLLIRGEYNDGPDTGWLGPVAYEAPQ